MSIPDLPLQFDAHLVDGGFFKSVFETAIDGIIIIDHKGIINMLNGSASKLFGYEAQELIGKNISQLMPDPHKTQHDQYLRNHLEHGTQNIIGIGREVLGVKKTGDLFPIRLAVSRFSINNQTYFTGVIHDLTAQKEAEKNLWFLNKNLENMVESRTGQLQDSLNQLSVINQNLETEITQRSLAERKLKENEAELVNALEKERNLHLLKSRFISVASHEFRTPLGNILSSLSLIDRYHSPEHLEQRNKHIHKIKINIHYLNGILNEFLSLTRIEEGQFVLKLEKFSLREFIQEIIEDFNYLKKNNQSLLFYAKVDDEDFMILSDRTCIRHILYNLLSNAIKYSGEQSEIKVNLSREDQEFIIDIEDNGIGIPQKEQDFIFDIFYRASNVLNIQGTGLGLNIVQKYLSSVGGRMEERYFENKGSKFKIRLINHEHKV